MGQLNDLFKDAVIAEPSEEMEFTSIPDGEYICELIDLVYGTSKSSGKPMITYSMRVLEGDYAGRLDWKHVVLEDKDGKALPGRLKAQLLLIHELMGYEMVKDFSMNDFEDLADEIREVAGSRKAIKCILTVKSAEAKKEGQSPFRNQKLEVY